MYEYFFIFAQLNLYVHLKPPTSAVRLHPKETNLSIQYYMNDYFYNMLPKEEFERIPYLPTMG